MIYAANLVDLELIKDGTVTDLITSEVDRDTKTPLPITSDQIKDGLFSISNKLWNNLTMTLESFSNRRHSMDFNPKKMSRKGEL